jgi:hypothetical protein
VQGSRSGVSAVSDTEDFFNAKFSVFHVLDAEKIKAAFTPRVPTYHCFFAVPFLVAAVGAQKKSMPSSFNVVNAMENHLYP